MGSSCRKQRWVGHCVYIADLYKWALNIGIGILNQGKKGGQEKASLFIWKNIIVLIQYPGKSRI
jgi:hypothetical protein